MIDSTVAAPEGSDLPAVAHIAVVIPVYNHAATVTRAVQSALAQRHDVQVVVVDDGSTDSPEVELSGIVDSRLRLIRQTNMGVSNARNTGAAEVSAPFLCFLDADDVLLPGALNRYLDVLDEERTPLVTASLIIERGETTELNAAIEFDAARPHPRGPTLPGSFAMATSLFHTLGGYVPQLTFGENTELLLRATIKMGQEGWLVPVLAEPAARISRDERGRAQRYGDGPAAAAAYILTAHAVAIQSDVRIRHNYHAIIGTNLLRAGQRRSAMREFYRALRSRPTAVIGWLRLVGAFMPAGLRRLLLGRRSSI